MGKDYNSTQTIGNDDLQLLCAELKRLRQGELVQAVNVDHFSLSANIIGVELESLRQFMNNIFTELQVTKAQVASAVDQIQDGSVRTEAFADTFASLKTQSAKVDLLMQNMDGRLISADQVVDGTGQSFHRIGNSTESINYMVTETTKKLEELNPVILQLAEIIEEMDHIANRVRMLSFNAAIEAAHAAEHGRGFSVVAQEMKNLADQSSNGVKSTAQVINRIKGELANTNIGVVQKEKDIQLMLAGMVKEASTSFTMLQELMNSIINDNRSMREEVNTLLTLVVDNFKLWELANENMLSSSNFLQGIGDALSITLDKFVMPESEEISIGRMTLEQVLLELEDLATADSIKSLNTSSHEKKLNEILKHNPLIEAIYSNRADGSFIYSQPPAGLANARARLWWQEAMQEQRYESPIYISAITRQPCITVALPIIDYGGKPCGVLAADLKVD